MIVKIYKLLIALWYIKEMNFIERRYCYIIRVIITKYQI
jgi:hypothetical protein